MRTRRLWGLSASILGLMAILMLMTIPTNVATHPAGDNTSMSATLDGGGAVFDGGALDASQVAAAPMSTYFEMSAIVSAAPTIMEVEPTVPRHGNAGAAVMTTFPSRVAQERQLRC